jgi:hypothetical protein
MGHQDKTSYSVSATRPPICTGILKCLVDGHKKWPAKCWMYARVVPFRTSPVKPYLIMTAGVIPPETGKDIFHLGLLLGGIWLDATVIDGLANRKLTY